MITGVSERPLASIVITNYNYARFLPEAIDSALCQTHSPIQIIIVDDGSTDESRQIIASYGDRVIPVFKENGGHPSAINAGFAASNGAIVSFLDADDLFHPRKIALVVDAWRAAPAASVIYHQLRAIDEAGGILWGARRWPVVIYNDDIAVRVERSGGWWPWPPTSGLSFARSYLERVLPMPEEAFEWGAKGGVDAYMAGIAPFVGPVVGLRQPLTLYRIHGQNHSILQSATKEAQHRRRVNFLETEFAVVKGTVQGRLGIPTAMALRDHHLYRYYQRATHPESRGVWTLLGAAMTAANTPLLPRVGRVREALKMLLRRY